MPHRTPVEAEDRPTPLKQRILLWLVVGGILVPFGRWLNDGKLNGDRVFLFLVLVLIGFLIAPIRRDPPDNVIERNK